MYQMMHPIIPIITLCFFNILFFIIYLFFLQFPKLCGMTGTAATESNEFESIYKLKVTVVPTNKPMIRKVYCCYLAFHLRMI